jgi:hypothetical protein
MNKMAWNEKIKNTDKFIIIVGTNLYKPLIESRHFKDSNLRS